MENEEQPPQGQGASESSLNPGRPNELPFLPYTADIPLRIKDGEQLPDGMEDRVSYLADVLGYMELHARLYKNQLQPVRLARTHEGIFCPIPKGVSSFIGATLLLPKDKDRVWIYEFAPDILVSRYNHLPSTKGISAGQRDDPEREMVVMAYKELLRQNQESGRVPDAQTIENSARIMAYVEPGSLLNVLNEYARQVYLGLDKRK